jgi:sugar/nucleoside kinase (ribokinase family)
MSKQVSLWTPRQINWSQEAPYLVDAVRNGKLAVLVGNGLSRLCGAPSWTDLFENTNKIAEALQREGIEPRVEIANGSSLLELGEVIWNSSDNTAWAAFINQLRWWELTENRTPTPSLAHRILAALNPRNVMTTNVDPILEFLPYGITYLHGSPKHPDDWIFSLSEYKKNSNDVKKRLRSALSDSNAILFIGYGHAGEDFDIIEAFEENDYLSGCRPYSLIDEESDTGLRAYRLRKLGIIPIHFTLPKPASTEDRNLAISDALAQLLETVSFTLDTNFEQQLNELRSKVTAERKGAAMVIGISALNTISIAAQERDPSFPELRRSSLRRKEVSEPGGPGLIVARLLATLDIPAALVSRITDDAAGTQIRKTLVSDKIKGKPICTDLLEVAEVDNSENLNRGSWKSYIVVDRDSGQRVFMDREVDVDFVRVSDEVVLATRESEAENIYFDKFYESKVRDIVQPHLERSNCWTYFESGERGSWQYNFEESTSRKLVNFALCSFHFALHFVGEEVGNLQENTVQNLLFGKRYLHELSDTEQSRCIGDLLNNEELFQTLCNSLIEGGKQWLRKTEPRIIVATLHEHGCLWVDVKSSRFNHVSVPPDSRPVICSASAGDTFRAAFIAGMIGIRKKNKDTKLEELPNFPDIINSICKFANQAAGLKVRHLRIQDAFDDIKNAYNIWLQDFNLID